jgi:iron-sulfur cluster repair protein YtfE (RIC family)
MEVRAVEAALEREHHEIDAGIEEFNASLLAKEPSPAPLHRAIAALRRHIFIEEEFLFPAMQEDLVMPTMVMLREHGEIWRTLDELEQRIADDEPALAQAASVHELKVRLVQHNQKEEPIFYTQADATLSPEQGAELLAFVEQGVLPDGWIPKDAISAEG